MASEVGAHRASGDSFLALKGANVGGLCLYFAAHEDFGPAPFDEGANITVKQAAQQWDVSGVTHYVDASQLFAEKELYALFAGIYPNSTRSPRLNTIVRQLRALPDVVQWLRAQGNPSTMFYVHYASNVGRRPKEHVLWTPAPERDAAWKNCTDLMVVADDDMCESGDDMCESDDDADLDELAAAAEYPALMKETRQANASLRVALDNLSRDEVAHLRAETDAEIDGDAT